MIVSVLVEDTVLNSELTPEHGLSMLLEWDGRKILFDTGGSGLFLENASKMGIPLADVEALILSHGHRDHTGGLLPFLKFHQTAPVYMRPEVIGPHYALRANGRMENIGTEDLPEYRPRLRFTDDVTPIDDSLTLFSHVSMKEFPSQANRVLFEKGGNGEPEFILDRFEHEQHLIVKDCHGKQFLFVGCSHSGIINIMERFIALTGRAPDAAIGGFHLMIPSQGDAGANSNEELDAVAKRLASYPTRYWTGHCTGRVAVERLRQQLGDRIAPIAAGSPIHIE